MNSTTLDPATESRRLDALHRLRILDTAPQPEFDHLAALAARLCGVPAATITFIDRDRQWFKATHGIELRETPRDVAFCARVVAAGAPFVVEDALADPQFAGNPLVAAAPHVRAYAGVPIFSRDGLVLGALAVLDHAPRRPGVDDLGILQALAQQVSALLEMRLRLERIARGESREPLTAEALREQIEVRDRQLDEAGRRLEKLERLHRSLWETTTDAVLILDRASTILYANPGAEQMFGYGHGALDGTDLARLQPERLRHAHAAGVRRYMESGVRRLDWRAAEAVGLRSDGTEFPVEISFSEIDMDGRRLFVGFMRDITLRKQAVAELHCERERAQSTLRCIADAVVTTDEAGRIVTFNPMAERICRWPADDAEGEPCDAVIRLVQAEGGMPLSLDLLPAEERDDGMAAFPANALLKPRTGDPVPVEGAIAPLAVAGTQTGWVITFRDVSQTRALATQVAFQATHDALTGLFNRAEFDRRLQRALEPAAEPTHNGSLLYLDLDQFKIVNDTCGHVAGDELVKRVATVLQASLRSSDTLARLGGDEFGVLLENCPEDRADAIAEKLRDAIAGVTLAWGDQLLATGVSIGHVHFGDAPLSADEAMSRADEACYVAKELGRNRIHTYRPGEETQARRHGEMKWVGLLQQALDEDRFELHAQPVYPVARANDAPEHFEILVRLRDRDGGLVPPMAFIPAAERYGLMPRLDRWVTRNAIAMIARAYAGRRCDMRFAINLSGATLTEPQFAEFLAEQLEGAGVPAACIGFEITETAAVANFSSAVRLIQQVRALGCSFALDDFGTGLSSFAYLKHLPVDYLKIDGGFVRGIVTDPVDRAMVASINEIGHLMGLRTIAEFVENEAILAELHVTGIDFAQGFGLGRPVPLTDCLPRPIAPRA